MFYRFILLAVLIVFSMPALAGGLLYDIEKEKTHVRFVAKMCTADVLKGEFEQLSGQIYFDQKYPEKSWVEATLSSNSLLLDKEFHGDHHIKTIVESKSFLNAASFPVITLKSTGIERTGMHTGIMTADMTLVGQTHPITLEVTFENTMTDRYAFRPANRDSVAFSAYGTFKRSDWGITYALDRIGIRRISDEVQILLSTTANLHQEQ